MSDALYDLAGVIITAVGAIVVAALPLLLKRTRESRDAADLAREVAEEAREFARPTGNGFAGSVLRQLAVIQKELADLRDASDADRRVMIQHLADHVKTPPHIPIQRTDTDEN